MSDNTSIEWAEASWNWATGCTKISPGCTHCYAERMAKRLKGRFGYPADDPFRVTVHTDKLQEPLRWKKPRRIFVNSMSDTFYKDIPKKMLDRAWDVMTFEAPWHTYLVLTKRPERAFNYFHGQSLYGPMPDNIWLGITAEDQKWLAMRSWQLIETPAAHRFLSVEPLLGPLDLSQCLGGTYDWPIHWVIVGGESGPGARPLDLDWLRSIREQCKVAGVPLFIKQLGTAWARGVAEFNRANAVRASLVPSNPKGSNMDAWPEDLQVREFPRWRCEPHYDLTAGKRTLALKAGAVETDLAEWIRSNKSLETPP